MKFVDLELTPEEILGKTPNALEKLKSLPPQQAETLGMFLVLVHFRYNQDEWTAGEILYWLSGATAGEEKLRLMLREVVEYHCQLIEENLRQRGFELIVQQVYSELEEDGKINLNWV